MPSIGGQYTWNDRQEVDRVLYKIDWVFVNDEWIDVMPGCIVNILPEGISDHCTIRVLIMQDQLVRKTFRYYNVWSTHPLFLEIVRESWNEQVQECTMFKVVKKLKALKQKLKQLNK